MHQKPDNSTRTIACIYCRISLSRFGDTTKVDDQEKLCRDLAAARRWTVDDRHVFKDNSVSAWRADRKRPGWDAMLAAVERGEVNAIIVYHGDRLIRQPRDLEDLIDLAKKRGIRLASPTGERDLDNDDDLFILRIEAAAAYREVSATSRRLKRRYDRLAEEGLVRLGGRGGRAFGFEPDGLTLRDADVEMIREVAGRILDGEAVGAICRGLNERGYRTTAGNEWSHSALSKLMQRPRLAGLVSHHGQIVGPAAWPAILDRDVWESVCAALAGKAEALGFRPANDGRYLLSGIAVCGSCGKPVAARHNRRGAQLLGYGCVNPQCGAKVHRAMKFVDAYVEGAVIKLLADPRVRAAMSPQVAPHLVDELKRLEDRRGRKVDELAEVEAFGDDDPLRVGVLRAAVGKIDARIGEIRAQLSVSLRVRVLDGLFGVSLPAFQGLPLRRRRGVVQALVRVTILRSGRRGPVFDPRSVRLEPAWLPPGEG